MGSVPASARATDPRPGQARVGRTREFAEPRGVADADTTVDANALVGTTTTDGRQRDAHREQVVGKHWPAKRDVGPAGCEPLHAGGVENRRNTPPIDRCAANESAR